MVNLNSIELFSGAGGLALGMTQSGFHHQMLVELNPNAINTLRLNHNAEWNIIHGNVADISFQKYENKIELLAGGPPCQPFSLGGNHKGYQDSRDMFPQAIRAVREVQPNGFIFENVKGLLRKSFAIYFEYIILQFTYPDIVQDKSKNWQEHLAKLQEIHTQDNYPGLKYNVAYKLLNAVNYGVPQKRERVFIVGFKNDLNVQWSFPKPTHSQAALWWQQWVTGEYWQRLEIANKERPEQPKNINTLRNRLEKKYGLFAPHEKPWVTLREAISDLPDPRKPNHFKNHEFKGGAKSYPGHIGSPLDEPAKTLKAGYHGVPGGENTIRFNDSSIRYLTVREGARVQTFPDDYHITGSWSECMRQIGNAVPVKLAAAVSDSVYKTLANL